MCACDKLKMVVVVAGDEVSRSQRQKYSMLVMKARRTKVIVADSHYM